MNYCEEQAQPITGVNIEADGRGYVYPVVVSEKMYMLVPVNVELLLV